jgi:hypothetical protein
MVDLFIRATEHMGMELPTMMTLGLREDAMTYCPFRVPAWMTEPQWQGYTSERSALPASRVMIYRSQKAFHLLYVIAATAKTTCVFERMPMLYAIPVVVEVAEAHPDPVNLRGLPFTINQEIAKCKGLGNALQRGLNAVRGELLKLAKAGWQMDAFDGNDVELIKPRTHMVMVLKAHLGLTPFTFAADALPSLPTVLEDIQAKLSDKGYKPMLRPYDQGTAPVVQPVAPPKRAMML